MVAHLRNQVAKTALAITCLILLFSTGCQSLPHSTSSATVNETVEAYMKALQQKDFERAASLVSDYSLSLMETSRSDVIERLSEKDSAGWQLLDYGVLETRAVTDQTTLVHVSAKEQTGEQEPYVYNTWVAIRSEEGKWWVNWGAVVDDRPLQVPSQAINDVTIQPSQIVRRAEGFVLFFKVENGNAKGVCWGGPKEVAAVFRFEDQNLDVLGTAYFGPAQEYAKATANVEAPYQDYPDSVDLLNWQWAVSPNQPEPDGERWSYHFELK